MPRRALISLLVFLAGAVGLAAGPLNLGKKNTRFQPGQALQPVVLQPARVKLNAGNQRFNGVTVQKITPLVQMPARVELGRSTLQGPKDAKIQPVVQPAAMNH
jgi:hypothetical protein